MLSGEPWCWTQQEINRHTDYYLWEIVIRPAVRRAREMKEESGPKSGHGWEKSEKKLPNRKQYIMIGEKLGVPAEISAREWDKYKAGKNGRNN